MLVKEELFKSNKKINLMSKVLMSQYLFEYLTRS